MQEHERVSWDGFQGTYSAEKVASDDSGESCVEFIHFENL